MYALPLFAVALLAGHGQCSSLLFYGLFDAHEIEPAAAANEHAMKVRSTMLFDRADISAGKGIDPDDIPEQVRFRQYQIYLGASLIQYCTCGIVQVCLRGRC